MADQPFAIGMAVGLNANDGALGQPNALIPGLTGSLGVSDGIVLGDRESGDADSGIAIPDFDRIARAVADVSGSFTKQPDSFQRVDVNALAITIQFKGNGATVSATPGAGEAKPDPGIDALWLMAGLFGAEGSNPQYLYTPATAAQGRATRYGTIKLWLGGGTTSLAFVLNDCIVESAEIQQPPGEVGLVTFNISVGSYDPASDLAVETFPTFNYGAQASLSAPIVQGMGFDYGPGSPPDRGPSDLTVTIANTIGDVPDGNQPTGQRKVQDDREIQVSGVLFQDDSDVRYEQDVLADQSGSLAPMLWSVGDTAGAGDTVNGYQVAAIGVQLTQASYDRLGTAQAVPIEGRCTSGSAGGEFVLTYR